MKLTNYVYEIYRTNEAIKEANAGNPAYEHPDIVNVGLSGFLDDVCKGKQNFCPVELDFAALGAEWDAMTSDERAEQNREVRELIAHNSKALSEAYPNRDKMLAIVNADE